MKILLVHNYYQQPGGEDQVFKSEALLLESMGSRVFRYEVGNQIINNMSKLTVALATVWNRSSYNRFLELLSNIKPDVVHFHNTFPLISPSAYYAVKSKGIPIIQTLHNYRLLCPNAMFFRDRKICENCFGKNALWDGIIHKCYRNSRISTGVVSAMILFHRYLGTWTNMVDIYIALTDFAREKFIAGGIPGEKIAVKPNFVYPDPEPGEHSGDYALFVGRLSQEKGIETMLKAWEQLGSYIPLKIIGDGSLADKVYNTAQSVPGVEWLGWQEKEIIYDLMGNAKALIFPSECFESLPQTIIESFAKGTMVIASRLGAMATLIHDKRNGLHFNPGDAGDLVKTVDWAWSNPRQTTKMGKAARAEYEQKYTAERNHELLIDIYRRAIKQKR
ncbi:MAG: glycosyltransferase [Firmicutes bacterium]|nr:glycosyltransferase [Bacillota bacterium]